MVLVHQTQLAIITTHNTTSSLILSLVRIMTNKTVNNINNIMAIGKRHFDRMVMLTIQSSQEKM